MKIKIHRFITSFRKVSATDFHSNILIVFLFFVFHDMAHLNFEIFQLKKNTLLTNMGEEGGQKWTGPPPSPKPSLFRMMQMGVPHIFTQS